MRDLKKYREALKKIKLHIKMQEKIIEDLTKSMKEAADKNSLGPVIITLKEYNLT